MTPLKTCVSTPEDLVALAEKCGAEVGRYEGEVVWIKLHQPSIEPFAAALQSPAVQPVATRQVGLFSQGADGVLTFHAGEEDAEWLCYRLDNGVTGGPFKAFPAFAASPTEQAAPQAEAATSVSREQEPS